MISVRDLQEQLTGELQGDVIVKQRNSNIDDFDFVTLLSEIPSSSPIMNYPIKYIYADKYINKFTFRHASACISESVLCIEVDGD